MTRRLHLAILRAAALFVPAAERAEWLAEWLAELCYVPCHATRFCLGAFHDALWLRRHRLAPTAPRASALQSPVHCIVVLALLAAVSIFFAFRLPLPRSLLLASPYRDAARLATIHASGPTATKLPTVTIQQFRSLAKLFPSVAYYSPLETRPGLSVAVASRNLFPLLGIPISSTRASRTLILSTAAWKQYFHRDPQLIGRTIQVAGQSATVIAILPDNFWRLPGRFDAWLLQDQPPPSHLFVLAQLRNPSSGHWHFTVGKGEEGGKSDDGDKGDDRYDRFECASLAKENLIFAYLLITLFSLPLLFATTPLALGDYPAHRPHRRWLFLALKIALLLPTVCCGTLDLASLIAMDFQAQGLILTSILGLRWALADQRRRCPVCLRVLTNPTRIGGLSHSFLEWHGTELICEQGHGLLYVPEISNSCYSTQRWQQLDPSWSSLF